MIDENDEGVEIRVEVPVEARASKRDRVRVQVSLYKDQAKRFAELRELSGLNNNQLASLLIMVGLRYIWSVMYPADAMSNEKMEVLASIFSKYIKDRE